MNLGVAKVSVYVADQDAAVDFWVNKVGCTVAMDMPYGESRWIEVVPPDGGTRLVVYQSGPDWPDPVKDRLGYLLFECDDINETYQRLTANGVEFTMPPKQEPWGWSAVFRDDEGHLFHLGQR